MPYTPNNNPYIPGDPYSYDLKWLVQKTKYATNTANTAASNASDALTAANNAVGIANSANTAAGNAVTIANNANTAAGNAVNTANSAANDAAAALLAANSALTAQVITSTDWIDSDNTTVGILDAYGVKIGNIFFFELQLNNVAVDHRMFRFKAPYNKSFNPTECALYTKSDALSPYDTLVGMFSILGGSNINYFAFTDVTLTYQGYISGVMILHD